jgi:hypothetical protein
LTEVDYVHAAHDEGNACGHQERNHAAADADDELTNQV